MSEPPPRRRRGWGVAGAAALTVVAAAAGFLLAGRIASPAELGFRQLTFSRGYLRTARFTPDGQSVVYGAQWAGQERRLYTVRTDGVVALALEPPGADLLAVSASAELVIALERRFPLPWVPTGTLARMPLLGGTPRPIVDGVIDADWAPDGAGFAVARAGSTTFHLEYPVGTVLYENDGYVSDLRFGPDGRRIAFMDHPILGDDRGTVNRVNLEGTVTMLTSEWSSEQGLAWSPDGSEVWFSATRGEEANALWAVDMSGVVRPLLPSFQRLKLHDVARDGRVLVSTEDVVSDIQAGTVGVAASPDGRSILALADSARYEIVPLDGGAPTPVPGLAPSELVAAWLDDGRGLLVYHSGATRVTVERFDLATGSREPWVELAPPDITGAIAIRSVEFSRNGRHFAYEVRRVFSDLFVVSGVQ